MSDKLDDEAVRCWFAHDPQQNRRQEIRRAICQMIALGVLKEGDALPGLKRAARLTEIGYSSVFHHVYRELAKDGVLRAHQGRAFVVVNVQTARINLAVESIDRMIHRCRQWGVNDSDIERLTMDALGTSHG